MSLTHDNPNHDHAVTAMGANTYGYDANGNQNTRNIGGSATSLTYDAENRLTGVSGAATATFVYDGDGNRVKGTIGGVTTAYIGNHFEWTGSTSTMKRYYYAGATRVAMPPKITAGDRTGTSTLNYLLGDHPSLTPRSKITPSKHCGVHGSGASSRGYTRNRLGSQSITTNSSEEPPSQPPPTPKNNGDRMQKPHSGEE